MDPEHRMTVSENWSALTREDSACSKTWRAALVAYLDTARLYFGSAVSSESIKWNDPSASVMTIDVGVNAWMPVKEDEARQEDAADAAIDTHALT